MGSHRKREGRKAKGIHVSETPTQKDVDEHMLTHIPFRSWSKFCDMGRGVSLQHRKIDKSEETIPTISIDYAFLIGFVSGSENHSLFRKGGKGPLGIWMG